MIEQPGRKHKGKNQNDPARFIKTTNVTNDGETAEKKVCELDLDRIRDEEKYDGFYAVITNLEGDIDGILKINRQRWEIEENFRIMKTDFEARSCLCQVGRPHQGTFPYLLHQPACVPPA